MVPWMNVTNSESGDSNIRLTVVVMGFRFIVQCAPSSWLLLTVWELGPIGPPSVQLIAWNRTKAQSLAVTTALVICLFGIVIGSHFTFNLKILHDQHDSLHNTLFTSNSLTLTTPPNSVISSPNSKDTLCSSVSLLFQSIIFILVCAIYSILGPGKKHS